MDLWVRSQDKTRLVKVCSLEYGEYNEIHYINGYCINEIDNYDLGTYKTKERALEVLDEIQNILKPQILIRRNDDNDKVLLGGLRKGVTQKIDMEFKELSTYVYEMPKE